MNTYLHTFTTVCPSDGESIISRLEIRSQAMIRVEYFKAAKELVKQGWHEQIADGLAEQFSSDQTIIAAH